MIRSVIAFLFAVLAAVLALVLPPGVRAEIAPLILSLATVALFVAIVSAAPGGRWPAFSLRLGAIGDLSEKLRLALFDVVGAQFVGGGRASLNFGNIGAGLQERLTITVTGALLGDFAQAAPETDIEAGLAFTTHVSAADTVTVTMVNNTAGAIDPAAAVYRVRVTREARR